MMFKRVPIIFVPELDEDSEQTNPIYRMPKGGGMGIVEALNMCMVAGVKVRPICWRSDAKRWVQLKGTQATGYFVEHTEKLQRRMQLGNVEEIFGQWETVE